MNINIIRVLLISMILFTGCNSWLDVKPQTEADRDELFQAQDGFKDALIGAYIQMKSTSIYGAKLMWGSTDYMAQMWKYGVDSEGDVISNFNYRAAKSESTFLDIFTNLYKTIKDVNIILEELEGAENKFKSEGLWELIKAEALMIRAYCHFDVLRLFGPVPTQTTGAAILPYVTKLQVETHKHLPYNDFMEALQQDLDEAEKLLREVDPITTYSINTLKGNNYNPSDDFFRSRGIRMNYYSVLGLKARVHLWNGDKEKALSCSEAVINATDEAGKKIFNLATSKNISDNDFSFSTEHIACLYEFSLHNRCVGIFSKSGGMYQTKEWVAGELFETGTTDIRFVNWWNEFVADNQARYFTILKYYQASLEEIEANKTDPSKYLNQLPLIRLAEMYFIAMECSNVSRANELYKEYSIARNIPVSDLQSGDKILTLLQTEYLKEFYGEGQVFYQYKRWNLEQIRWRTDKMTESEYVVPLPKEELSKI